MKQKIRYSKKSIRGITIIGLLYFSLEIIRLIALHFSIYLTLSGFAFMILCFGYAYLMKKKGYLIIDGDMISSGIFGAKNVNLNEVNEVRRTDNDNYFLITDRKSIKINPRLLDEKSYDELELVLKKYDLEMF